jgi:hypothetical protein
LVISFNLTLSHWPKLLKPQTLEGFCRVRKSLFKVVVVLELLGILKVKRNSRRNLTEVSVEVTFKI